MSPKEALVTALNSLLYSVLFDVSVVEVSVETVSLLLFTEKVVDVGSAVDVDSGVDEEVDVVVSDCGSNVDCVVFSSAFSRISCVDVLLSSVDV